MSASAFVVSHNEIIALSDGLTVNLETLEKMDRNHPKVHKISDQTLIASSGNIITVNQGMELPKAVQKVAADYGVTDPINTSELLRKFVIKAPKEANRLNYTVMGFDSFGKPRRIHFTHSCREGKEKSIGVGNVGVMAHECDGKAQKMFETKLNKKYRGGKGLTLIKASIQAWTETIIHYEKEGYLFGGDIFSEVVRSPIQN